MKKEKQEKATLETQALAIAALEDEIDQRERQEMESRLLYDADIVGSDVISKSMSDPFSYTAKLRTGELVVFESSQFYPGRSFIHLVGVEMIRPPGSDSEFPVKDTAFERGVDVRISDIVWVRDNGS